LCVKERTAGTALAGTVVLRHAGWSPTNAFITSRPPWRSPLWRNYDELTSRAMPDNRRHGNRGGTQEAEAAAGAAALYLRPSQSNFCLSDNDDDAGGATPIRCCSVTRGIRITPNSDVGRYCYYRHCR